MSFALFFAQSFLLLFITAQLFRQTRSILPARLFIPGLCLKILAGWLVGFLYKYFYAGGDTFLYYQNALELSDLFICDPLAYIKALAGLEEVSGLTLSNQPRAWLFARMASLSAIGALDNYWLMSISFSWASFLACWWFAARLKAYFGLQSFQVCIPFLFFPSVIFWSSGLLKESITTVFILYLIGFTLDIYKKGVSGQAREMIKIIVGVMSAIMLWQLKYYYAAVLLPVILIVIIMRWMRTQNIFSSSGMRFVVLASGLGIFTWIIMQAHPNLQPQRILHAIVRNHKLTVAASQINGYVSFSDLQPPWLSFIKHYPQAVFHGLFAPLPGVQGYSILHLVAGLENLCILLLSLFAVYNLLKNRSSKNHHAGLWVLCFLYIILLAGLITLASPNFGSLLRYRVAYEPFWLLLVLLTFPRDLSLSFPRSRKKTYTNIQGER